MIISRSDSMKVFFASTIMLLAPFEFAHSASFSCDGILTTLRIEGTTDWNAKATLTCQEQTSGDDIPANEPTAAQSSCDTSSKAIIALATTTFRRPIRLEWMDRLGVNICTSIETKTPDTLPRHSQ